MFIYPVQKNDPHPPNQPNNYALGFLNPYKSPSLLQFSHLVFVKKCYAVESGAEWCYLNAALKAQ